MSLSSNNGESCDVIQDLLAIFNKYETRPDEGKDENLCKYRVAITTHHSLSLPSVAASVICLSATCVCLVLCLLLNIYIAANIFYKKKFQVSRVWL